MVVGVPAGLIAGYYRGAIDKVLMRLMGAPRPPRMVTSHGIPDQGTEYSPV